MISACSSGSSGTALPSGSSPVADPGVWPALTLTRTCSPGFSRSATSNAVISFVRLAIARARRRPPLPEHLAALHVEEDGGRRRVLQPHLDGGILGNRLQRELSVRLDRDGRPDRVADPRSWLVERVVLELRRG